MGYVLGGVGVGEAVLLFTSKKIKAKKNNKKMKEQSPKHFYQI